MSGQDSGEKTEKATPEHLKKVRSEGNLQRSQDLATWVVVAAAAVTVPTVIANARHAFQNQMHILADVGVNPSTDVATRALVQGLATLPGILTPLFVAVVIAAIAANAVQGGVHIAKKKFKPQFSKVNPLKGAKKFISMETYWKGAKDFLKTVVVGVVLYMVAVQTVPLIRASGALTLSDVIATMAGQARTLVWTAVVVGMVLAIADVVFVMKRNRKQTRMSKKQVKDEYKRTEGDPHLKGAIRAKQMEMSRNRMITAVADADVVVVNPTHVAVALKYDATLGPPRVVAKGRGVIAQRIREKAEEARVPIVHDIPLARALATECQLGQEIPPERYEAVARVLAFVMSLRKRGAAAGTHRMPAMN